MSPTVSMDVEVAKPTGDHFEHGKTSKKGILLRPQPTNDPNEPLNWPQWEKYSTYLVICWYAFLAFMNSSAFTVAIEPIIMQFETTPTRASYLTSLQVLFMGFGALFWMPLSRTIGKRPSYLLSILGVCVTNIWSYFAGSYGNLLAARLVGGFLSAAGDAPVSSVVTDLFYFHERGHTMMMFNMAISSGAFLGPLINAYIVEYVGWQWMCGVMAVASGATFVISILLLKETAYVVEYGRSLDRPQSEYPPKRPRLASLSLTAGYDKNASFVAWMLRCVVLFGYPPVLVAGLTVGLFIGCNIAIQITSAQTFLAPPWSWQAHSLGLFSIAGFVGAAISFFLGGRLIDLVATRMTARHHGQVQPEYRLPAMLIPAAIGPMGLLTFGLVVASAKSWGGAAVGFGMEGFGATAAANIIITYAVDAYRPISGETIVVVFIIRNVIACLISTYISAWFEQEGLRNAFGELVAVAYVILSLSLVLYLFGRTIRAFTSKFGPMSKLDVDY